MSHTKDIILQVVTNGFFDFKEDLATDIIISQAEAHALKQVYDKTKYTVDEIEKLSQVDFMTLPEYERIRKQ